MRPIRDTLIDLLKEALSHGIAEGKLQSGADVPIVLGTPPEKDQGDYATPWALSLAKIQRQSPRHIADLLVSTINASLPESLEKVEIGGAGYINFFMKKEFWRQTLLEILKQGKAYGRTDIGSGKKILIEFVSANPTGPLHVAHGRAAALGDALTRLLRAVHYQVEQEYYINDVGAQMTLLGQSTALRYRELLGDRVDLPQEAYHGDYIIEIAKGLYEKNGDALKNEEVSFFMEWSYRQIFSSIQEDLRRFGINFDRWCYESKLWQEKKVDEAIALLSSKGMIYEADGAVWVATTRYGDDKDRVILRQNGQKTYFASDIAYHRNKFERGYDRIINIWGADHHGYIERVRAAVCGMGYPSDRLQIIIHQLVTLLRNGKPVPMSKRSGEFVPLRDVMDEVGVDATRFFYLMRRSDTPLDFDLELAKATSDENPVYYVQYAHARICSIIRVAVEQGIDVEALVKNLAEADFGSLQLVEEMELIKKLSFYPDLVKEAASKLEPHRINGYLMELAGLVHRYYFKTRVITDDTGLTAARMGLIAGVQIVLKSALGLLGVTAPDRM